MTLSTQPSAAVQQAVTALRRGGLVAFPTETVYGLGADAENPQAVARLFVVKGRPSNHPLIVHIGDAGQLEHWARDITPAARLLARRFWPGPLTLVFRRSTHVPDAVTGGQDTVGLRVPDHPLALALLGAFGGGIAAPSANRFGRLSPTTAAHVRAELGTAVDTILDGGPCRVGIESTIVDVSSGRPRLLRPGAITAAEIEAAMGEALAEVASAPAHRVSDSAGAKADDVPRVPGTLLSHYAPQTPLTLVASADLRTEIGRCLENGERVAVLACSAAVSPVPCPWEIMSSDPAGYMHEMYARLHTLDALHVDRLLVETPPSGAAWRAVHDRLARAAWKG